MSRCKRIEGVGLGLRWEFLDDVLDAMRARDEGEADLLAGVAFFEISPENYMRRGGYFPDALARVGERFPLLTHGLTMSLGGVDPLGDAYMRELGELLARIDPPFHSDHLCFSGTAGRIVHDLLPVPFTSASAKQVAGRVREAADRLERPMAVENITHYMLVGSEALDEPAFIGEVLSRSDARLLFDVNNVFVNAKNHGFDPLAWMDRAPIDRVASVHVAGHERDEEHGVILDTHGAPVENAVLGLLERAVECTGPIPVVLERDHNVPELSDLLTELDSVRAAYARGVARFSERRAGGDHGR
jgi:uncharacterized protein (UPF0276 family)